MPGLAGNTLVQVDPNGVLILTLNADARISVSGQPAVDVSARYADLLRPRLEQCPWK